MYVYLPLSTAKKIAQFYLPKAPSYPLWFVLPRVMCTSYLSLVYLYCSTVLPIFLQLSLSRSSFVFFFMKAPCLRRVMAEDVPALHRDPVDPAARAIAEGILTVRPCV